VGMLPVFGQVPKLHSSPVAWCIVLGRAGRFFESCLSEAVYVMACWQSYVLICPP
jgi:hypothetical protein